MQALDLVGPHALDQSEVLLAQLHRTDDVESELLRRRRCRLLRSQEVAADEVLDRFAREPQAQPACLLVAGVVEGNVDVALEAQLAIPVGLAVADQDEFCGHG